ncbi:LysR family transcriptional regulator [Caballeronia sp. GaOx3]|uniref:LysR family transcriptional regulator n=1 Tax=Caballeronia sp. GaOx3 TaxID=2921740 RepID=UPI002028373A|nr:LysR family transcriptional regulator [Caballeronia sp. GaOx3]
MNLSHKQLRYICEVARLGSIQASTESLHISQSSILAAISIAEELLGARIFDRRPSRGIQITRTGERFVTAARTLLAASGDFNRQIADLVKSAPQTLKVACFEPFGSLFVAEALRRFVAKYGDVEILLYEGDQVQLRHWLASGEVELIITYDIGPTFGEQCTTKICQVPGHALLSSGDSLAEKNAVSIAELATRPLVLLDLPQTSTYLTSLFDVLPSQPHIGFRARSYETVKSAVSAGFGMALLHMMPGKHSTQDGPGLVRRPIIDSLPAPTLIVADIYGNHKPAFVRSIIEIVEDLCNDADPIGFAPPESEAASTLLDVI